MFTGLISGVGTIRTLQRSTRGAVMQIAGNGWNPGARDGDSIAVDGVCLTLTQRRGDTLVFDVLLETLSRTSLGEKPSGAAVNLESAMKLGEAMGGHWVTGHVDGVGVVSSIRAVGRDREIKIRCHESLLRDMIVKGSVACDGISLTLVEVRDTWFSVHIIPYTWEHTAWRYLRIGAKVNLETDVMAKYIRKHLDHMLKDVAASRNVRISDILQKAGFE